MPFTTTFLNAGKPAVTASAGIPFAAPSAVIAAAATCPPSVGSKSPCFATDAASLALNILITP